MVGTQHNAHLDEARCIFGKLALEPQQADDIPHVVVPLDEGTHIHPMVRGLLTPVIANAADDVRWNPHLHVHHTDSGLPS